MEVTNSSGQGYGIKVLGIRENGVFLADLSSMARALRLRSLVDGMQMQIDEEFGSPASSCILTAGNSFSLVVPASPDVPKRLLQLSTAPVIREGRLYMPVAQTCRMFSLWLDKDLVYDASSGRIRASLGPVRAGASSRAIGRVLPESLEGGGTLPGERPEMGAFDRPKSGPTVIEDIQVETMANGCVIRLVASGGRSVASYLRPDVKGTAYLTIEKATGNMVRLTKRFPDGAVSAITPMQLPGGGLQFTIILNTAALMVKSSSYQYDPKNNNYELYVMSDVDVMALRRTEKERMIQQQLSRDISKWKLDAVVIDAGHGGKDPGAIGTRGTREKDVVLNVANDLGMFIKQQWPDVKVIYTRRDDRFIPLNERGKIANRYGGKLFVSIHCNSTAGNSRVRGSEVYILGPHKTQAALDVAMFENSVITSEVNYKESYKGFTDEYLIMSSMAQSAFATQSTELAQDVLRKIDRYGSNTAQGVRQAGFMVLWTPSMPSILVETGYLSNPDEEKILRNREQQAKIAYGIFQGLQQYRSNYETRQVASGMAGEG
ncbi:MAG: N-acetylmuramoyl-L-alanine amidase [Chlorobiaceae bacterium]|nr:N-acetylmuramoyl-L-alanine amidase [Chlorobiaceae bacterium]NTW74594.1 N-acetylmuramoyl-L-alanine amidase [Chlorobiaceae bacterium]